MKKIKVKSLRGAYQVLIGENILGKTGGWLKGLGLRDKVMIITQPKIAALYLEKFAASLKKKGFGVEVQLVDDSEAAKSQAQLFKIFDSLCVRDFERKDVVLALGGGVTGDLSGFAAACYFRGVPFVNVPTTLLAQVDSSIGGKTGINLAQGKNLVGAFYPPQLVISDIATLKTLPGRELHASLAEVVKYGVIRDPKLFVFLEKNTAAILQKNSKCLEHLVAASAAIKAGVVSRDEFETSGERMILNFGHTFGHGFEQALDYKKLLHGEAVALGMVSAAKLAVRLGIFDKVSALRLTGLLKRFHLPVSAAGLGLDLDKVLAAMSHDKKKKAGRLRFVLPVKIGKVVIRENIADSALRDILQDA